MTFQLPHKGAASPQLLEGVLFGHINPEPAVGFHGSRHPNQRFQHSRSLLQIVIANLETNVLVPVVVFVLQHLLLGDTFGYDHWLALVVPVIL